MLLDVEMLNAKNNVKILNGIWFMIRKISTPEGSVKNYTLHYTLMVKWWMR